MADARHDGIHSSETPPSPSPLAGEGKGEGASQDSALRSASSSILNRPLIRPTADAAGHLLPRGEKGALPLVASSGLPAAFFWINLAQRRARSS